MNIYLYMINFKL